MYSPNFFLKRGTALFCGKFSHVFSSATFNSEMILDFGRSFQEGFMHGSPDKISAGVQIRRVRWAEKFDMIWEGQNFEPHRLDPSI